MSELRPARVHALRLAGDDGVEVHGDHGDAGHEVRAQDDRELDQAPHTPVEDLLRRMLRPLEILEDGDGQLRRDVIVDLQGDEGGVWCHTEISL